MKTKVCVLLKDVTSANAVLTDAVKGGRLLFLQKGDWPLKSNKKDLSLITSDLAAQAWLQIKDHERVDTIILKGDAVRNNRDNAMIKNT